MAEQTQVDSTPSVRLTNDDFRKLLATPRAPSSGTGALATTNFATPGTPASVTEKKRSSHGGSSERGDLRRKKKNFYAALKKQEDNKLQELSEKYRDRARERRDGANPDYQNASTPGHGSTNAYRAVAPDLKSGIDAAERRKRIIQESKFLGGDMEHTHLVKGLDYALLQKVRSELQVKEQEEREIAAAEASEKLAEAAAAERLEAERREAEDTMAIKGSMARNIYNLVQSKRSREIQRMDLFAPSRMAYVIDLEDDTGETDIQDIPTTLIRSKYEVPINHEDVATLTTNDIVINKLSQILSYLRAGGRNKKNKKRDKDKPKWSKLTSTAKLINKAPVGDSIYDDIGDYQPPAQNDSKSSKAVTHYSGDSNEKPPTYFGDKSVEDAEPIISTIPPPPRITKSSIASRFANEPEGYAECYPGLEEMNDAIDDSDDEVDYTKMDLGNKKGPIGRWDFDTQEEYSDYMSTKEALPKAAFQYGKKLQDGRKTRKHKTDKNEKAELDREWQKIQASTNHFIIFKLKVFTTPLQGIIQKRKIKSSNDDPEYKQAKF
uniref:RED-like N-terminal domain-containing protein n=1 Tax=Glossina morsitans morsitans TaxID=37546 RepID=A0A1B0FDM0_GLOMM